MATPVEPIADGPEVECRVARQLRETRFVLRFKGGDGLLEHTPGLRGLGASEMHRREQEE